MPTWSILLGPVVCESTYLCTDINNTCFICGKAEDVLPELLNTQKMTADHVISVVDPPRAGLR